MPTSTTTYTFQKPTVGGDSDVWGGHVNDMMDKVDDLLDGTLPITPATGALLEIRKTEAATNTVTDALRLNSQTSGTPAAGIGVGLEFAAETAAGNTEVGAIIEAVTTDVTAASEDFDLVFRTMAAGAAAAERMRVRSTGQLVVNGAEWTGAVDPENRIVNGGFDFWQRATSSTALGYVAADRWRNDFSGGTVTQSRQAVTVGTLYGVNNPAFVLRQSVTGQTLTAHYAKTEQRIEGVRSYAGQTITILGWAQRTSGGGNMAVEVVQNFGTGGSPSAEVTGTGQLVTLTGSVAAFAITVSVPSITGKTIGTNLDDYLALNFWTSAGSDFNTRAASIGLQTINVDMWGIHIKLGTHTTAAVDLYKAPELGPELARCQRYYEKSYALTTNPGTATGAGKAIWSKNGGGLVFIAPLYCVRKRISPTFSYWDLAGNASRFTSGATNNLAIGAGGFGASEANFNLDAGITGIGANSKVEFQWAADAEL